MHYFSHPRSVDLSLRPTIDWYTFTPSCFSLSSDDWGFFSWSIFSAKDPSRSGLSNAHRNEEIDSSGFFIATKFEIFHASFYPNFRFSIGLCRCELVESVGTIPQMRARLPFASITKFLKSFLGWNFVLSWTPDSCGHNELFNIKNDATGDF